ncbi:MAG: hypothetical protein HQL37_03160 [Alphaproteobacteria bacterium]|nr:hypothetical protein [Alphaproteobacteria bacterium]
MVEWNGLMVDARQLSLDVQEAAARKGIIPYVPAYHTPPRAGEPDREDILERYRWFRRLSTDHQTAAAKELLDGPVADIALRLGLIRDPAELVDADFGDLAPALDIALFGATEDGVPRITRYAQSRQTEMEDDERTLLESMGHARFSVFEVMGRHVRAGMMVRDMIRGDEAWLMDIGLEKTAPISMRVALRLIRPEDFWMSTGVAVQMDETIWRVLERDYGVRRSRDSLVVPDDLKLDEVIFKIAIA